MAFTRGHIYRVTFDTDAESYQVQDQSGRSSPTQSTRAQTYLVQFNTGRLMGVQIVSADFDGTHQVRFDALVVPTTAMGLPHSGVLILQGARRPDDPRRAGDGRHSD